MKIIKLFFDRRAAGGPSSGCSLTAKVLMIFTSVVLVCGIAAGIAVPFFVSLSQANTPTTTSTTSEKSLK